MRYRYKAIKKSSSNYIRPFIVNDKNITKYVVIGSDIFKLVKTGKCSGYHVQNMKTMKWLKIIVSGSESLKLIIKNKG